MLFRLLLLLTVVPIVELTILLRIAQRFQWGPTIVLVLLTGVLGAWLARREGMKAMIRIQEQMASGIPPTGSMVDGMLILIAGVMLVTPGILTDLCGFALLVGPCRRWIRGRLVRWCKRHVAVMHGGVGGMTSPGGMSGVGSSGGGRGAASPGGRGGTAWPEGRGAGSGLDEFIDVPATSHDARQGDDPPRLG